MFQWILSLWSGILVYERPLYQLASLHLCPDWVRTERGNKLHDKLRYLSSICQLLYVQRLLWCLYVVRQLGPDGCPYDFRRYDVPLTYYWLHITDQDKDNSHFPEKVNNNTNTNTSNPPFLLVVIYLFEWFHFYTHYALRHRVDRGSLVWHHWYSALVRVQDRYRASKLPAQRFARLKARKLGEWKMLVRSSNSTIPGFLHHPLSVGLTRLDMWLHLDRVDKRAFFDGQSQGNQHQQFIGLSQVSRRLTAAHILMLLAMERFAFWMQSVFSLITIAFLLNIAWSLQLHRAFHPLGIVWALLDGTLIVFGFADFLAHAVFFVCCTLLGTLLMAGHVREADRAVGKVLGTLKPKLPVRFVSLLRAQLRARVEATYLALDGQRKMFGGVLFVFLLTNMPLNIYLVKLLYSSNSGQNPNQNQDQHELNRAAQLALALGQAFATLVVFFPLTLCHKVYHSQKRVIPRLLALTYLDSFGGTRNGSAHLWRPIRFKLDDLYGRLRRGPKLALTIGPVTAITSWSFFRFIMLYIGYLLIALTKKAL